MVMSLGTNVDVIGVENSPFSFPSCSFLFKDCHDVGAKPDYLEKQF